MIRVGVDFGGTKIEAAALGPDGAFLARVRAPNPGDYDEAGPGAAPQPRPAPRGGGGGGFLGGGAPPPKPARRTPPSAWASPARFLP